MIKSSFWSTLPAWTGVMVVVAVSTIDLNTILSVLVGAVAGTTAVILGGTSFYLFLMDAIRKECID